MDTELGTGDTATKVTVRKTPAEASSGRTVGYGIFAVALLVALAVGAELMQGWMPGRSASVLDGALGCAGVGVGGVVYWAVRFHKGRGPKGIL